MNGWKKAEYDARARAYVRAFRRVASELGDSHPLVALMGSLAWGRYEAEGGPDQDTLRDAAVRYGFLWGVERLLVCWCNQNGHDDARNVLVSAVRSER